MSENKPSRRTFLKVVAATTAAGHTRPAHAANREPDDEPATVGPGDIADLRALNALPPDNDTSRLYLRLIERWIPTGLAYYQPWELRPNTGHFFGGAHWYGLETAWPSETFACAAIAPDYDEAAVGVSREDLIRLAISGLRFLAFTHDTGPEDCVRPSPPYAHKQNAGTKWGERGRGYFPESQCTWAIGPMTRICALLRDHLDEETLAMVARVVDDYARRFDETNPWEGVYHNTQMEENGWTAWGLASAATFLGRHERAEHWMNAVKRWTVCIATTPQDSHNRGSIGGTPVADYCMRHVTTLPDYWAENHHMVHPTYTASGVMFAAQVATQLTLFGHDIPDEVMWNRNEVYANLRAVVDDYGYFLPVQGMDWDYLPGMIADSAHGFASVFLSDPIAAAMMRRTTDQARMRLESYDGRFYDPDIAARAHDIQDPLFLRELAVNNATWGYLFHRLLGPGAEPASDEEVETELNRAQVWPHAGTAHNRHPRGQTAFSWRNSVMALPVTREGITFVGPTSGSYLGQPAVMDRPASQQLVAVEVDCTERGFTAAMTMDRAQRSVRQQVLFASLSDGRTLSFERFVAQEDLTIEELHQGELTIINENYPAYPDGNCRGKRVLYGPEGSQTFEGWLGESQEDDERALLGRPAWLNVDDRMGFVFQGSGETHYLNRHYHRPFHAVHDRLILSVSPTNVGYSSGQTVGWLAALVIPHQSHGETLHEFLQVLDTVENAAALLTRDALAVANFEGADRELSVTTASRHGVYAFLGATSEFNGEETRYTIPVAANRAATLGATGRILLSGPATLRSTADGTVFVTNPGPSPITAGLEDGTEMKVGPGDTAMGSSA